MQTYDELRQRLKPILGHLPDAMVSHTIRSDDRTQHQKDLNKLEEAIKSCIALSLNENAERPYCMDLYADYSLIIGTVEYKKGIKSIFPGLTKEYIDVGGNRSTFDEVLYDTILETSLQQHELAQFTAKGVLLAVKLNQHYNDRLFETGLTFEALTTAKQKLVRVKPDDDFKRKKAVLALKQASDKLLSDIADIMMKPAAKLLADTKRNMVLDASARAAGKKMKSNLPFGALPIISRNFNGLANALTNAVIGQSYSPTGKCVLDEIYQNGHTLGAVLKHYANNILHPNRQSQQTLALQQQQTVEARFQYLETANAVLANIVAQNADRLEITPEQQAFLDNINQQQH